MGNVFPFIKILIVVQCLKGNILNKMTSYYATITSLLFTIQKKNATIIFLRSWITSEPCIPGYVQQNVHIAVDVSVLQEYKQTTWIQKCILDYYHSCGGIINTSTFRLKKNFSPKKYLVIELKRTLKLAGILFDWSILLNFVC